jgi:hypothetical protein
MSKLFLSEGMLLGVFAKYAISQSPYYRPDNLETVIDSLHKLLGDIFTNAPLGIAEFTDNELYDLLHVALARIPEYVSWNDRKNGNDAPMQFTSRYDTNDNPDDDFIDLDALERNVIREIEVEQA